jgi:hypothetical protein
MNKRFRTDIDAINATINEAEKMLKEAMNFCEDDDMGMGETEMGEEMPMDEEIPMGDEMNSDLEGTVESYVDHIRKYSLNGLSALCDNPESEEYQMLKKIFQMCDKKPEKKEGMVESRRIFGVLKENRQVIFEAIIENPREFNNFKKVMVENARRNGVDPSKIRLVSENKILR